MASLWGAIYRNWLQFKPPVPTKQEDALKFGILGAAMIAPVALILPAKSHPGVIIQAVAARDHVRAEAFAKKHGIPEVKDSYEAILDDPAIDAVYIPLPCGLHLEWTLKALAKGKHVLLEKPACGNATDAERLFNSPLLKAPNAPVLLEAFHSRFSPMWRLFNEALDKPNVEHVLAGAYIATFILGNDHNNIRFNYDLAGGTMLDVGTYPVAAMRSAFGAEPEECLEADLTAMPPPHDDCDVNFKAKFRFPNGGIGEVEGGLRGGMIPSSKWISTITVKHRPVVVRDETVAEGEEVKKTRTVKFLNFMFPPTWHRIDITDDYVVTKRDTAEPVRKYTKKESKKAYTFKEMGVDEPGEIHWMTYRHMLEQFVNRVRGREGTGAFVSLDDSIAQAKALDLVYEKSHLEKRPTSQYRPDA